MPGRTRQIEYYRLWSGNGSDSGTWDTDFVEIPTDTPDDQIDQAVEKAVAAIQWRDEPPIITGVYSVPEMEEGDDTTPDSGSAEADVDQEYGDEDHCPAAPHGVHSPDWSSASFDTDAGEGILDVACQHCGRSGSIAVDNEDINW